MALRHAAGVRRYATISTKRFPLVVAAIATLPVRSCLIDGEAIVSDDSGLAVFDLIRSWPTNLSAVLCAFDLLEHDGQDLRRLPLEVRKAGLAGLLRKPSPGVALHEHYASATAKSSISGPANSAARASCRSGRLVLSLRPIEALAQGQESGGTGGASRGGRGR